MLAVMNAVNIKASIARNVQRHVSSVQKNAGKWQHKLIYAGLSLHFLYSAVDVGCKLNGRVRLMFNIVLNDAMKIHQYN